MEKYGKTPMADNIYVFIVEYDEGPYVNQIATPNVHHFIYRVLLAREALSDRSVKLVSFLLL